jgi:hypothetical protein
MANTQVREVTMENMRMFVFETTSAATTETVQLPLNKNVLGAFQANIGGTATSCTFSYVKATGVGSFSALTSTNNVILCVITD